MVRQVSIRSSLQQNKEKYVQKWVVLQIYWKITFSNKYLNNVYFTYILFSTFTVHVPSLITVELLLIVKSKFTANVLHLNQCTYEQFQSWTVAHFQRSRSGCEWFDRHQERVGVMSVLFQLRVIALDVWRFPTHTNLHDWVWTNVGAVYRKYLFADIR